MKPGRLLAGLGLTAGVAVPVASRLVLRRGADRLLAAPRRRADETALRPALDALGGEVVRLRSRDGVALAGRWLLASAGAGGSGAATERGDWRPDPREAVLLLHGYSGSIAPDLVEYAPFLRTTAHLLGLDFRGHGESADGPTTFGALEVEDVAGALAWLGERGIRRVAMLGTSMGGIVAIASAAVLGDGRLGADDDLDAPRLAAPPPRPRIVGIVADSVSPQVAIPVGRRLPGPFGRRVANRLFDAVTRQIGRDPRATEPIRSIGLLEGLPLLLIHGEGDRTVPLVEARRLAAAAPPGSRHIVIPGADHSAGHRTDPLGYESEVTAFFRAAFVRARGGADHAPILPGDALPGTDAGVGADERA